MNARLNIPGICCGALLFLSACSNVPSEPIKSPEQVVRALFEDFNRHDSKALAAHYAIDGSVISPETCSPLVGREAIQQNYQDLFDQLPDVHDEIKSLVASGQDVAVEFVASASMDGAPFTLSIAAFLIVENGLIISDTAYFDTENSPVCE